jgi:hypothetical protein
MLKNLAFIFLLVIVAFTFSCEEESDTNGDNNDNDTTAYEVITPTNPIPQGDRELGINISNSIAGWDSDFQKATEASIQVVELNLPWSSLETAEGIYNDPDNNLQNIAFYGFNNIKVGLSIAVINTVAWEYPAYLEGVAVNSTQFIDAFKGVIDFVIDTIPDNVEIASISVGNEVDLVLQSESDWLAYTEFYEEIATYINTNYPNIPVGVKTTIMGGVFGNELDEIQAINEFSDIVMLNYYPQNERFEVLDVEIAKTHLPQIVAFFPGQEIWLTEVGYQSGNNLCKSSEKKQAEYIHHFFEAWDTHKNEITHAVVNWLHDQSPAQIDAWKDYYGSDPALVEYLSTLGLRTYENEDKAAWLQLKEEVNSRGWTNSH